MKADIRSHRLQKPIMTAVHHNWCHHDVDLPISKSNCHPHHHQSTKFGQVDDFGLCSGLVEFDCTATYWFALQSYAVRANHHLLIHCLHNYFVKPSNRVRPQQPSGDQMTLKVIGALHGT